MVALMDQQKVPRMVALMDHYWGNWSAEKMVDNLAAWMATR